MCKISNIIIVLFLTQFVFSQKINFSLESKNCHLDSLFLSCNGEEEVLVSKNNKFSKKINLKPGFCLLNFGDYFVDIYLIENANLKGFVDCKEFYSTLKFKGIGSDEANFMIELQKISESIEIIDSFKLISNVEELKKSINNYKYKLISILPKNSNEEFLKIANERIQMQINYYEEVGNQTISLLKLNGEKCPEFSFKDINEKEISLNNFKNKFLLIDIWASWCSPCIDDLKYLEEIKKRFNTKAIEFVSISIDDKVEVWKNFVINKKLNGIQLISSNGRKNDFFDKIMLITVPRYILIGPDGKIVNADASRPSSPELVSLLDSLVK